MTPADQHTATAPPQDNSAGVMQRLSNFAGFHMALSDPPDQPFLMYRALDGDAVSAVLIGNELVVGRNLEPRRENGLELAADTKLSRSHFKISRIGDCYRLDDLDSRNGVFVNTGERIKEFWLTSGDCILAGDHVFIFANP